MTISYVPDRQCKVCKTVGGKFNNRGLECVPCWYASRSKSRATDPRQTMINSATSRGKVFNVPCTIKAEDFTIPSHCPILGIPLAVKAGSKGGADNSPSLDRIDRTKGYVPGNIQVISRLANAIKNSASIDQLERMGQWATEYKERLKTLHGAKK